MCRLILGLEGTEPNHPLKEKEQGSVSSNISSRMTHFRRWFLAYSWDAVPEENELWITLFSFHILPRLNCSISLQGSLSTASLCSCHSIQLWPANFRHWKWELDENKPIDHQVLCWIDEQTWLLMIGLFSSNISPSGWFPGEYAPRKQIG